MTKKFQMCCNNGAVHHFLGFGERTRARVLVSAPPAKTFFRQSDSKKFGCAFRDDELLSMLSQKRFKIGGASANTRGTHAASPGVVAAPLCRGVPSCIPNTAPECRAYNDSPDVW